MEAVVKAALSFVEEVGVIQVVINPSPISPTPPTCLTKTQKSTRLPIAASPNGRLHTFPYFVFVLLGGFIRPLHNTSLLSDSTVCYQIFNLHPNPSFSRLPPF